MIKYIHMVPICIIIAMASNLLAMASNLIAMVPSLLAMVLAMASNLILMITFTPHIIYNSPKGIILRPVFGRSAKEVRKWVTFHTSQEWEMHGAVFLVYSRPLVQAGAKDSAWEGRISKRLPHVIRCHVSDVNSVKDSSSGEHSASKVWVRQDHPF